MSFVIDAPQTKGIEAIVQETTDVHTFYDMHLFNKPVRVMWLINQYVRRFVCSDYEQFNIIVVLEHHYSIKKHIKVIIIDNLNVTNKERMYIYYTPC